MSSEELLMLLGGLERETLDVVRADLVSHIEHLNTYCPELQDQIERYKVVLERVDDELAERSTS